MLKEASAHVDQVGLTSNSSLLSPKIWNMVHSLVLPTLELSTAPKKVFRSALIQENRYFSNSASSSEAALVLDEEFDLFSFDLQAQK